MAMATEEQARLIALLKRDSLRTGEFTLASGRTSHYYVDGRKVTLSAQGAAAIASGVLDVLSASHPSVTAIGGLTMGADPIVGAALAVAGLAGPGLRLKRGFLVRKEAKGHGTGQARSRGRSEPGHGRGDRRGRRHHRGLGPPGGRRPPRPWGATVVVRGRPARPPRRGRRSLRRPRRPRLPRPGRRSATSASSPSRRFTPR